ncbi:peptidylprolyl isomerase [Thiocapsa marina]|uniref:peptidylprolyl isomerase n=1 Tax=Thiocapsa marina 5811 TaxID=768671 RepID=F9U9C7_9GAMM|nr:peptidyl-prolyl cis-trans isomerase [Thiocapsa marina]EGV19385.1 PpiC-type peptidyl-prolyl cis-trans isomerase [Thiocapsa marina 5811]
MRFLSYTVVFCACLLIGSSFAYAEPVAGASEGDDAPVAMARVGEHEITVEQFMQFLTKNPGRVQEATTPEGKGKLLRTLVEVELVRQAMLDAGSISETSTPEEQKIALAQLAAAKFPLPPAPDEDALREYYEHNKDLFGIPASVRLSQIQLRVPEGASEEEKAAVRARAEAVLERLEAGESFAELASSLTENPRAKGTDGDLGFVWRDGHEWLESALEGVEVGQHTAVLESPVGFDILMLTDEREAVITPFEQARDSVVQRIQAEGQEKARQAYVASLAKSAKVELLVDDLKTAYPNGLFETSE